MTLHDHHRLTSIHNTNGSIEASKFCPKLRNTTKSQRIHETNNYFVMTYKLREIFFSVLKNKRHSSIFANLEFKLTDFKKKQKSIYVHQIWYNSHYALD